MNTQHDEADTRQARWARFRFSIVGPLLSAPPEKGELNVILEEFAKKQWRHPITNQPVKFGFSTLERWFYQARKKTDPVNALRSKRRTDAGQPRKIHAELKVALQQQYRAHPSWSYQLHRDNLKALSEQFAQWHPFPSYSTLRRYMYTQGFLKQRQIKNRSTLGAQMAAQRLEKREVRSFEMDHVHALWHLDFHHGSRPILTRAGTWHKPLLLAIMDDRSRLICHAQWYVDETVETLVHGFIQALQKRALPRALMSDNGAAMTAAEFTEGLERLGIVHQPTLPYSPYQNAKQEVFWAQVEGRLMAMLEGEAELTLDLLNQATLPWVEFEYHQKFHSELHCTPMERYLAGPSLGRLCPPTQTLRQAFCTRVCRKQRRSDGTLTLDAQRFEIPSPYRHLQELTVQYARWDLSLVLLIDPHTEQILCPLYPQDKSANAAGKRRALATPSPLPLNEHTGLAPLLKKLIEDYAATGLPPAYIPKGE